MGIFDLFKSKPRVDVKKSISVNYTPMVYTNLGIINGAFDVSEANVQTAFRNSATIFTGLDWIATKASNCPLTVFKINSKQKAYDYFAYSRDSSTRNRLKAMKYKGAVEEVESDTDPLVMFLKNPHPTLSLKELTYISIVSKKITGSSVEAFLTTSDLMSGKDGKINRIVPLPTSCVLLKGGNIFEAPQSYMYSGHELAREFKAEDVMHIRNSFNLDYETNLFYRGQSQFSAGSAYLEISKQGEQARNQMFKNGGATGVLYEKPREFEMPTTGEVDDIQNRIDSKILGVDKLNKIVYFPTELGYIDMGKSLVDMGILENEKMTDRKLCAMMGIDATVIGIDTESGLGNGGSMEQGIIKSINDGVIPELLQREDVFNDKLCPRFGDYKVQFDIMSFPQISGQMLTFAEKVGKMGVITKNETRDLLGYDQLDEPMMNEVWESSNVIPMSERMIVDTNIKNDGSY